MLGACHGDEQNEGQLLPTMVGWVSSLEDILNDFERYLLFENCNFERLLLLRTQ
jgi:hypothetical protein